MESLQPFTKDDLSMRGIIDLIFDFDSILQLYPCTSGGNIPKVMLEKLRCNKNTKSKNTKKDAYIGCQLVWTIDGQKG